MTGRVAGEAGRYDVFEYAVLQVVPVVERDERVNVGVVLLCQPREYLAASCHVDSDRLRSLGPDLDVEALHRALAGVEAVCAGDPMGGDPAAQPAGKRFRWLTAPRSALLRAGPVHAGLTTDPAAELSRLLARLVL